MKGSNNSYLHNLAKIVSTRFTKNKRRISRAMHNICAHPHVLINKTKFSELFEYSLHNNSVNVTNFNDPIAEPNVNDVNYPNHGFIHSVKEALCIDEAKRPLFLAAIGLGAVSGTPQKHHIPRMTKALSLIIIESKKILYEKLAIQRQLLLYVSIGDLLNKFPSAWHELSLLTSHIFMNPKSYF